MTALNECRSPQWNLTHGGRALLVSSSVPGNDGSRSINLRILLVYFVTGWPSAVVSKNRLSRIEPDCEPVNCSFGTPLPAMAGAAQLLECDSWSSPGLNRHGSRSPPSISRNAFSLLVVMSEDPREMAPASAFQLFDDALFEDVDDPVDHLVDDRGRGFAGRVHARTRAGPGCPGDTGEDGHFGARVRGVGQA